MVGWHYQFKGQLGESWEMVKDIPILPSPSSSWPGMLWSMGSQMVGGDLVIFLEYTGQHKPGGLDWKSQNVELSCQHP